MPVTLAYNATLNALLLHDFLCTTSLPLKFKGNYERESVTLKMLPYEMVKDCEIDNEKEADVSSRLPGA